MRINPGEQENTEISFAPLIDCIFLLLIFFLVATSFKQQEENKKQQELNIDLPTADASFANNAKQLNPLVISVTRDGELFLNYEAVTQHELHNRLQTEGQSNPERRIRIDGDRLTPYQNIVHVLDMCQFAGLTNIGVHTLK